MKSMWCTNAGKLLKALLMAVYQSLYDQTDKWNISVFSGDIPKQILHFSTHLPIIMVI